MNGMQIMPVNLEDANLFVRALHRHHQTVKSCKFCIAVSAGGVVHGVAIISRPVSRYLDNGWTLEIQRLCTDGYRNACSMLYAAAWKAAKVLGYKRIVTYTLPEEGGASLRAVGWHATEGVGGMPWNTGKRKREENPHSVGKVKTRWEASIDMPDSLPPQVTFAKNTDQQSLELEGQS